LFCYEYLEYRYAESYLASYCNQLQGPALFARRHVSTTFPFPFPVSVSGVVGRRVYDVPMLPAVTVAIQPVRPPAQPPRVALTTCLQNAQIIDDFRRLKVYISVIFLS